MNQYNYNNNNEVSGGVRKESGKAGFSGASYAKLAKSAVIGAIAGIFSTVSP